MKAPYLFVYSTIHIRKVDYVLLLFHAFTGVYMSEEESQWFFFFGGGGGLIIMLKLIQTMVHFSKIKVDI